MEIIPGLILPLWSIITIISVAAALLIFILIKLFLDYRFLRNCDRACADDEHLAEFIKKYGGSKLLRRSKLLEKAAAKNGLEMIIKTGIDRQWQEQFIKFKKSSYLKRFIKYFPEKGIFFCILSGKTKPSFEKILKKMLEQNSDSSLLKKIGIAAEGVDFDGEYAAGLFADRFQEIIELTGDPEWFVRFFAVKMLIYMDDERAVRAGWEAFSDSSSRIRTIVAAEFKNDEEKLSSILRKLLLEDPSFDVRKTRAAQDGQGLPGTL